MRTRIHGCISLPDGFVLMSVPRDATFRNDKPSVTGRGLVGAMWEKLLQGFRKDDQALTQIASNYSVVKIIVALGQTLFAVGTLYRARGDQVDRFGYAAFGLTVAPYAWMSVINLVGLLMCPEYPARYLVESEALRKLRALRKGSKQEEGLIRGAMEEELIFDGVVGALTSEAEEAAQSLSQEISRYTALTPYEKVPELLEKISKPWRRALLHNGTVLAMGLVPVATIGGFSRFHRGSDNSAYQRAVTMSWLALEVVLGTLLGAPPNMPIGYINSDIPRQRFTLFASIFGSIYFLILAGVLGAAAILGFVVVGEEISQYGVCIRVA
jgi:hypothetical protein